MPMRSELEYDPEVGFWREQTLLSLMRQANRPANFSP